MTAFTACAIHERSTIRLFFADRRALGHELAGANVHDTKLLNATVEAIVVERSDPG